MTIDYRLVRLLETEARLRQVLDGDRLKGGGGDGTSGGMSDDWKNNVEAQLSHLHADVRKLLIGLIAGFLFLLVAGAGAYVKVIDQVNASTVAITKVGGKVETLNAKIDDLLERVGTMKR